jgi:signal transduction histidine kinase
MSRGARTWAWMARWLDPLLAAAFAIPWVIELTTTRHKHGSLPLNIAFALLICAQILWRRRAPLAFALVVNALAVLMTATLTNVMSNTAPVFVLFVPPYTVAAFEERGRALTGLGACLAGGWALSAIAGAHVSDFTFVTGLITAAWAAGRALRGRRLLADELKRKADRIASEREGRVQLAIADERTRIARELHALVAGSVTAMVVQTEAAGRLLDDDLEAADAAMASVEATGREALAEMRRILGVLRRGEDDTRELAPQPGVGQIHALIERYRRHGRQIELCVEGEPGPLPASVDLGIYRVLEEALAVTDSDAEVALRLGDHEIELEVGSDGGGTESWPTLAMRERVALCSGELDVVAGRLMVRMPRVFEEVFA